MAGEKQGVTWDLTSYFPEFDGAAMRGFKGKLREDIEALQRAAGELDPLGEATAGPWEEILLKAEDLYARFSHIYSYVECLGAAHSENEAYSREMAELTQLLAEVEKFDVDVLRAFKDVSDGVFEAFTAREGIRDVAHYVRRIRERAKYTMSPAEEKLAADLNVDGFHSWGRLYDKISGKLEFGMVYPDGREERTPIARWRSLMADADRAVGRAAFEGGNRAWQAVEDVCAAALNAISGTRLALYRHRGVEHFLDRALFQASITRETLEAMYRAISDNIEIAREIFRAKARAMGREGIWWFEREAPLPMEGAARFSWEQGSGMVGGAFERIYPALAEYYRSFLEKRWIESEVRAGKRPGAFCTGSPVTLEQRVYMTFNGALSDVTTIAHEVGHAFHGHTIRRMRPWAQEYPMTLAETASIFAELITAEGIYADDGIDNDQKLLMLDADLCNAAVLLLDITVRFEFEKAFYEERKKGEVSVSRLKELMVEAERRIFADALLEDGLDPYFWASKLHFYITHVSFYNFPYTFGFLIARALFNLFQEEGASFLPRYEEFLKLTGSDTVEEVARRSIGADVRDPAFWAASIGSLEKPLALYKELLEKRARP
jgi:oligoendopeptidase F